MARSSTSAHTLLLLRHAQAVDFAPGLSDHERPLTDYGIAQAESVGAAIRSRGISIDQVICSSALRTRQTFNALGLDAPCEVTREAYNAGSDALLELIRLLPEEVGTALLIGHGPGVPTLAAELAGPGSDRRSVDVVNVRYPTATLAGISTGSAWADLAVGRLEWLRIGA